MRVVWNAFNGRYADNPRALHEGLLARGLDERAGWEHTWLAAPHHAAAFPPGVRTAPIASAAAEAATFASCSSCSRSSTWPMPTIRRTISQPANPRASVKTPGEPAIAEAI